MCISKIYYSKMLITSSWLVDVFLVITTTIFLIYKYSTRKYDYWKKRGIFYKEPLPLVGNFLEIFTFRTTIGELLKKLYDSTKEPFFGIFAFDEPHLVLKSPQLIKQILVKDFSYFMDRTILSPKHDSLVSNMMFIQKNPNWKIVRPKMTPVFTSGKLKGMFPLINNVGVEMNQYIRKNLGPQEAKEICAKFSTDVIAKCAFGINAHSFNEEDADFRKIGRSFFDFRWRNAINQTSYFFMHGLVNLFRLDFIEKWAVTYLSDAFWHTIRHREEINMKGNDLIDILVEIRKNKDFCKEMQFEGDAVVAQAVQFFTAGFETTSSTIGFTLYELCIQPQIQDKLRREIVNNIKEHNGITYEGLQTMKYLDLCIMETLRKYPVLPFLDRRCNADYKISGTDVVIEKGIPVYIPMLGLHYDEQYFPEPNKYIPDRFSDKNVNADGLYYLPFGEGPRICIGERFGMLGTKLGLVHILSEFELERTADTPVPLEFEPKSFILQSKVGIPMRFKEYRPRPG